MYSYTKVVQSKQSICLIHCSHCLFSRVRLFFFTTENKNFILYHFSDFTFVPLVIIKHYSSSVELQLKNVVDKLKDETVDTTLLSGILKTNSLLTDIDVQDIDTERINRQCEKAALLVLVDRVVTFHPDSWYQNFLECLCKAGMEDAVTKIEPGFGNA